MTTTSSRTPLIKVDWVQPGTHISAIGADAPGKQELESDLIKKADLIIADSIAQCMDHGEVENAVRQGSIGTNAIVELGAVLGDPAKGRSSEQAITISDLTGIAAQDIAMAGVILSSQIG